MEVFFMWITFAEYFLYLIWNSQIYFCNIALSNYYQCKIMENTEEVKEMVDTLPEKFADRIRRMIVNERIDVTERGKTPHVARSSALSQAKLALPQASFATREHDGKIWLVRTG
jgi:hypothetical protein